MTHDPIRVGIVGAGRNTRAKHIPGLRAIEGVEILAVANRTPESGERAAKELGIPKAFPDWRALAEWEGLDAVVIGTWPCAHMPATLAALERGKHVLCEARMAMDAREARLMLDASKARPGLVAQVVPAPHTLEIDGTVAEIVASGELGGLLAVELDAASGAFADFDSPMTWRHDREKSGLNAMDLGIMYEALMRWVGPAVRVCALARTFVKARRTEGGGWRAMEIPDHVEVLADMACGAAARMRFSAVAGLAPGPAAWLHGTEATLKIDLAGSRLFMGRRGEGGLSEREVPEAKRGAWRVEEEFVNAIRGLEEVKLTTFEAGLRYMEFTEGVTRSAQTGRAVALPLG